jgi:ABC-type transporter Mla subunit MlaD
MDFLNRAIDQAKPFVDDAVKRAKELQRTVDDVAAKAEPHLQTLAKNASSAANAALDALREATKPKPKS